MARRGEENEIKALQKRLKQYYDAMARHHPDDYPAIHPAHRPKDREKDPVRHAEALQLAEGLKRQGETALSIGARVAALKNTWPDHAKGDATATRILRQALAAKRQGDTHPVENLKRMARRVLQEAKANRRASGRTPKKAPEVLALEAKLRGWMSPWGIRRWFVESSLGLVADLLFDAGRRRTYCRRALWEIVPEHPSKAKLAAMIKQARTAQDRERMGILAVYTQARSEVERLRTLDEIGTDYYQRHRQFPAWIESALASIARLPPGAQHSKARRA